METFIQAFYVLLRVQTFPKYNYTTVETYSGSDGNIHARSVDANKEDMPFGAH